MKALDSDRRRKRERDRRAAQGGPNGQRIAPQFLRGSAARRGGGSDRERDGDFGSARIAIGGHGGAGDEFPIAGCGPRELGLALAAAGTISLASMYPMSCLWVIGMGTHSRVMRLMKATAMSSCLRVTIGQVVLSGVSDLISRCGGAKRNSQSRHLLKNDLYPDLKERQVSRYGSNCKGGHVTVPQVCLVEHEPSGGLALLDHYQASLLEYVRIMT